MLYKNVIQKHRKRWEGGKTWKHVSSWKLLWTTASERDLCLNVGLRTLRRDDAIDRNLTTNLGLKKSHVLSGPGFRRFRTFHSGQAESSNLWIPFREDFRPFVLRIIRKLLTSFSSEFSQTRVRQLRRQRGRSLSNKPSLWKAPGALAHSPERVKMSWQLSSADVLGSRTPRKRRLPFSGDVGWYIKSITCNHPLPGDLCWLRLVTAS